MITRGYDGYGKGYYSYGQDSASDGVMLEPIAQPVAPLTREEEAYLAERQKATEEAALQERILLQSQAIAPEIADTRIQTMVNQVTKELDSRVQTLTLEPAPVQLQPVIVKPPAPLPPPPPPVQEETNFWQAIAEKYSEPETHRAPPAPSSPTPMVLMQAAPLQPKTQSMTDAYKEPMYLTNSYYPPNYQQSQSSAAIPVAAGLAALLFLLK